ncbi:MAG: phosphate acyltransferase [bacterium]|nr:phosphate acyltransferase [bacterium]
MLRIAVDTAGGEFAPIAPIEGALQSLLHPEAPSEIILVSKRSVLFDYFKGHLPNKVSFVEAETFVPESISPLRGIRSLPNSTITVAHQLVRDGRADAVVSAGSTGAQLAAAVLILGKLRWVLKPALGAILPKKEKKGFLLDVGANPSVHSIHLVQFAAMGAVFVEQILQIHNPRVALLSNGTEAEKGTDAVKGAYHILQRSGKLNFVGSIEGNDILTDRADVVVTDGFTGNIFLKFAESLPSIIEGCDSSMLQSLEPTQYGGVPILGVRGVSVVCHGKSNASAFTSAILEAVRVSKLSLPKRMEKLAARLRWQRFMPHRNEGD